MWVSGLIGFIGSCLIAGVAYSKRALSASGAIAAIVVGTIFFSLGGLSWYGTLIAFFVSSTLLTKWRQRDKSNSEKLYEKTGRRDAEQVMANGGIGLLLCVLDARWPHVLEWGPNTMWWIAFVGVMATVNADTWATEIGSLSRHPRSILTGRSVPPGTSGGVSLPGLVASMAGGLFIGLVAQLFRGTMSWQIPFVGLGTGLIGSLSDSLLGATVQCMYMCPVCRHVTERRSHCGQQAHHQRGWRWMNNDAVNVTSSLVGAVVSILLAFSLHI